MPDSLPSPHRRLKRYLSLCRIGKQALDSRSAFFLIAVFFIGTGNASALITGGKGNQKIDDPGWPAGAAKIFNWPTRVAWWEGPPLGGGQWHAESKGDAKSIAEILQLFAKMDAPVKRVTVKSGVGFSFWMDPSGKNRVKRENKIDWELIVWTTRGWQQQVKLPAEFSALRTDEQRAAPIAELKIYTGAIDWNAINIPDGLEIVDTRIEARGYSAEDGRVVEGSVLDNATQKPLQATIRIESITAKKTGGYDYALVREIPTDPQGHWVIKNFGSQWSRVIAVADGYAARVIHHAKYDRQPGWERHDTQLVKSAKLAGIVVDQAGTPIRDANIHIGQAAIGVDGSYKPPETHLATTDASGRFSASGLPRGTADLLAYHPDFIAAPGRPKVDLPDESVEIVLTKAGKISVEVVFAGQRPANYLVEVQPIGGEKVGSWGGSATLGADNRYEFSNVPAGKFKVHGRPNPGRAADKTEAISVEVKPGVVAKVVLKAR